MGTCPLPHPEQSRLSTSFINKNSISHICLEKSEREQSKVEKYKGQEPGYLDLGYLE